MIRDSVFLGETENSAAQVGSGNLKGAIKMVLQALGRSDRMTALGDPILVI